MFQTGTHCSNSAEFHTKPFQNYCRLKNKLKNLMFSTTQMRLTSDFCLAGWTVHWHNPSNMVWNPLRARLVLSVVWSPSCLFMEASSHCSEMNSTSRSSLLASGGCDLPTVHLYWDRLRRFRFWQGLKRTFPLSRDPDQLYLEICRWITVKAV